MLTLSQPIQLNSTRPFLSLSDSFQERITGNYELLRAHFTPKDLLFLLTAPPDLPEDLGGMTTIAVENNVVDARRITLEAVNHVLNRILLSDQPSFTYQDQVYITSVLNKLGITDVQQFMEQVRQLREENQSVTTLLRLYQQEGARLRQAQAGEAPQAGQALAGGSAPAEEGHSPGQRYYLHNAIYRRLETGAIYNSMNAYQSSVSSLSPHSLTNSLQLSEQLRVSQLLSLNQLRHQSVYGAPLTLLQRVNHYELGDVLPPPRDEEQVLSQAAEAALLSSVDHVLTQAIRQAKADGSLWLELEQSLSQSVDNALSRFESYHSADAAYYRSSTSYEPLLRELYREEASVLEQFHHTYAGAEGAAALPAPGLAGQPQPPWMEHITLEEEGAQTVQSLRELTGLQRELVLLEQAAPPGEAPVRPAVERGAPTAPGRPGTAAQAAAQVIRQERERILETVQAAHPTAAPSGGPSGPQGAGDTGTVPEPVERLLRQPPASEEERQELLARELREIDRHNREIHQRVLQAQAAQQQQAQPGPQPPDRSKLMADALRAVTSPEQVIRELLEQPAPQAPKPPPQEVRLLLNQADETTRSLYESILLYESNPAAAQARGMVSPGSLGSLNSEAARQRQEGLELIQRLEGARQAPEEAGAQSQGVLEQIRSAPAQEEHLIHSPAAPRSPVQFVHRQQADQFTEELVERLEQRQTSAVKQEVTTQTSTQQTQEQLQHNTTTQTLVTQTSEDITALINRTLAKQMSLISDKVYHQMEKRLQTERYRRGRF